MPRPRYQRGHLTKRGTRTKKWIGTYFTYETSADGQTQRVHRSVVIGLVTQLRKQEAQRILDEVIARETHQSTGRPMPSMTLGEFVTRYYLPARRPRWRKSTATVVKSILDRYVSKFYEIPVRNIDKLSVEIYLGELATQYSFSVVSKVRTYLKSIMADAEEVDLIERNPLRRVKMPITREPSRPFLSIDEVKRLLAALNGWHRLVVMLALSTGLRPEEIFALRWRCLEPGALRIEEAVVEGTIGPTKTPLSRAKIAIPAELEAELRRIQSDTEAGPDDWIWPSQGGTPMDTRNFRRHYLTPAAAAAGLSGVTLRHLRRTFATLAHQLGQSPKSVQAQLRHASMATTMDVYTQPVASDVRATVEAVFQIIAK